MKSWKDKLRSTYEKSVQMAQQTLEDPETKRKLEAVRAAYNQSVQWTEQAIDQLTKEPEKPAPLPELPPEPDPFPEKFVPLVLRADNGGVLLGTYQGTTVGKPVNLDGHILVVGGSGSGKTSCIALPTLMFWHAPVLAVDIKGELARKSGRRSCIFNPCKPDTYGYDPFYFVQGSLNPIPELREIALTIVPLPPDARGEQFWIQSAQNLLTAHLIFSYHMGVPFADAIRRLQTTPLQTIIDIASQDEDALAYLSQFADGKKETLASIMMQLSNAIIPFATDPDIQDSLRREPIITPNLLEQGNDVFLQIPEYKLKQWRALLSLIVQQFLSHFERRPEENPVPTLFLLDEFPRLSKMDIINGLATLRSKKVTIMLIIQSLAQLDAIYGHDERKVICDNCAYKAILNATDADTQKYFSQLVGTEERTKETVSYKAGAFIGMPSDLSLNQRMKWIEQHPNAPREMNREDSKSQTTEEKPIIKPEDFAYLKDIVALTPYGWGCMEKLPYYQMERASA